MREPAVTDFSFSGPVWRAGRFEELDLFVDKGIVRFGKRTQSRKAALIVPPFCDPHVHGGWGIDIQAGEFGRLEEALRKRGVGRAVPTLMNDTLDNLDRIASGFRAYRTENPLSIFPFLRVEGPFISPEERGAQPEEHILPATRTFVRDFLSMDAVRMFTFAPEVEGTASLVRRAVARGRIPSVGHSRARMEELRPFLRLGVRHMTHFPNAMSGLHHREIGLLGAGLLIHDLHLEIIADGVHTSTDFLSLVLQRRGTGVSLASDMIPPAGSDISSFAGLPVRRRGSRLTRPDGTIVGGASPVPEQARFLASIGIGDRDIVRLACLNAPRFLGLPVRPIAEGRKAEFLVLDSDWTVRAAFLGGERVA